MGAPIVEELRNRVAGESPGWLTVTNRAGVAELRIHGVIGDPFDGNTSGEVAERIAAIDADEILVVINSPGGSIFDGIAITNALRSHPARVVTRVDGLAASIASVIVQAGDERVMSPGAQMMIHRASGVSIGDADTMLQMAELLDRQDAVIAGLYVERGGQPIDDVKRWMADETWYDADEAVMAGLADRVGPVEDGQGPQNAVSGSEGVSAVGTVPSAELALALLD